ncbi:MAG: polysaccharide biosynthesis tyrosine autokinase [Candidatus Aminicenantales bacterium]
MNKPLGKKEVDLLEYWRIILKRKWVIVSAVAALVALAAIFSFTATPLYKAKASILIEEQGSNILNIQDLLNSSSYYNSDFKGTYFNTQLKLLTSRSLAERVVKKLSLASRPEFQNNRNFRAGLLTAIKNVLSFRWIFSVQKPDSAEESTLAEPDPYAFYANGLLRDLSVEPVPETQLVEVGYTSPYSQLSAEITNTFVEEFINYSVERRFEATQQTSEFLNEQIAQLREDLATKERELQKYGEEKKLILNEKESNVVSKFNEVSTAYTEAQIERIRAETVWRELSNLKLNAIPLFVNNPLIQSLKTNYAQLKSEFEEKSKTFKPEYPEMIQLRAKLDSVKNELEMEIQKAVGAAESDYRAAQRKENSLLALLEAQRVDVVKMNNNRILYKSLEIEVENKRNLLNSLVAKQNETLVSAKLGGLSTSNIKIVDRALVPEHPVSPNTQRNLIVALLLGLIGGIGLAFFTEFLDNTIKGPEDLEKLANLPSLGVIPYFSSNGFKKKSPYYSGYDSLYGQKTGDKGDGLPAISEIELINHLFPRLSISEDYRTIRTSIMFSHADNTVKTIVVTSSSPQEGKSATLANLAISFSQLGEKVLAVDADLRKPRLHKIFKVRNINGLSGYLKGRVALEEAIQKTAIHNFWLLPSGPLPPNPAELLNSRMMKELIRILKEKFNVVLIDTPPVLAVIDPVIVSSLTDSTVIVLRMGKTMRRPFLKTVEELRKAKADIIGVIFNEAKLRRDGYYLPYFQYEYYQEKDADKKAAAELKLS